MDILSLTDEQFLSRLCSRLAKIYPKDQAENLATRIVCLFTSQITAPSVKNSIQPGSYWSERDVVLITYGNSVIAESIKPLQVLYKFLMKYMKGVISTVHILPFFPYSSDDGFAVIDYKIVNKDLGSWSDIKKIAKQFKLMADLVINHISSKSKWFQQYIYGEEPGRDYFIEVGKGDDISQVVRPRSAPLLQEVNTSLGKKYIWCTFSFDQVDLDFSNPDVFLEFIEILHFYLQRGIRVIRLDAIAFLWKEVGTPSINLPQTHEIVKTLRLIVERFYPGTLFVTETNIPNFENLKYFGNSNEAHIIYNFSLAPLILHALWSGNSEHLAKWSMSLPPAPMGCTYLNFTATHDGIGLRPVEDILSDEEIELLIAGMQQFGGEVTTRSISDAEERPYEINITWFEAMKGNFDGVDEFQIERFLCSQIIMLGLEGIPAFYINSLLAAENDYEKFAITRNKRSINRKQWNLDDLETQVFEAALKSSKVFYELKRIISIRSKQSAFHPNSTQFILHLGDNIFGIWRQSMNRDQSIFAIHNLTNSMQELHLSNINLTYTENWVDLISWDTIDISMDKLVLRPYQCQWVTNKT